MNKSEIQLSNLPSNAGNAPEEISQRIPNGLIKLSRVLVAAALSGCAGDTIINNNFYYPVPDSSSAGSAEFLDPSACGIEPNVDSISDMEKFAFYEDNGMSIAVLIDQNNYEILNQNLYAGDYGWIQYDVDGGEGVSEDAVATVCITSPDGTETACVEGASVKLAGGMTATFWCGDGTGSEYVDNEWCYDGPTIPVFNIDLNHTDHNAKIFDTVTGKSIDNIRINSGQYLGLKRAHDAYNLSRDFGLAGRLTTFVNIVSNIWGLNNEGDSCVSVPELNVMRDQDGLVCKYFEDTLDNTGTLNCDHGWEGYGLWELEYMQCEWSETENEIDEPVCDEDQLRDFSEQANSYSFTNEYSSVISNYTDVEYEIRHLCGEFALNFWDGIKAGNNFVAACLTNDSDQCQYRTIPYSMDYTMFSEYWVDPSYPNEAVGGYQSLTQGFVEDPSTCQLVVDTCMEMIDTLEANCLETIERSKEELIANDMWRSPQDDTVQASQETFCASHPEYARETLDSLNSYCSWIGDTGFDSGYTSDTAVWRYDTGFDSGR